MVVVETRSDYSQSVKKAIYAACARLEVPFDIAWAICQTEIGQNLARGEPVEGIGEAGETGIMQVTPIAMLDTGFYIDESADLDAQAEAGVRYLKLLLYHYNLSIDDAIRAYNVGPSVAQLDPRAGSEYLSHVRSLM